MVDYHLTIDNTANYTKLQSVRYPKAGDPNPKVSIWIYDVASKIARKGPVDGESTQYLYAIRFSPDGTELLVNRTNRRQDVLTVLAVDMTTLNVRTFLTERQSTWQENSPAIRFLEDNKGQALTRAWPDRRQCPSSQHVAARQSTQRRG